MSHNLVDIKTALERAKNVLIIAHTQPDGDTLGSCFALYTALINMGKSAQICCDSDMPKKYEELFPPDILKKPETLQEDYDTAAAIDCADKARLGKSAKIFKKCAVTINIDHHVTNDKFAQINYITDASSVGEIIFELLCYLGVEQNEHTAKYIYIAISTDTGNFTYSNTNKKCLAYVSELVELIDVRGVADVLFRRRSMLSTKLIGRAISSLETFEDGKIAFISLLRSDLKELGATGSDCENIVDFAREIEETLAAVFYREIPGGIKVSMRSKDDVDVCAIAKQFGGGGHKNAAGCCIKGKLDEVKKIVLKSLTEIV